MMFTFKRIVFTAFTLYALFGSAAAIISSGMKGSNGPLLAAIFILTLLALDIGLIRRCFRLSEVNRINMIAIMSFYFFSITLPLCITCPSPLSPVVAFAGFSLVTFVPFTLISYLMKRTLIKISSLHNT